MDRIVANLAVLSKNDEGIRRRLQVIRIDKGLEFSLKAFEKHYSQHNIQVILSIPYNQYENGIPERGIRFL
jgi:transposase InsO family protein